MKEQFESICKVELQGRIGSVRITEMLDTKVAYFTLATTFEYLMGDEYPVVETTWHKVTAFGCTEDVDLSVLKKGAMVHVIGRIRQQKYTTQNGEERTDIDIMASEVSKPREVETYLITE